MKRAIIDVGSNSIRLFINLYDKGTVTPIKRELKTTRLGRGVAKNGNLDEQSLLDSLEAIRSFKKQAEDSGCDEILVFATSAVREAKNRHEFVQMLKQTTGFDLKVLSGEKEAELSFQGVKTGLGIDGMSLVIDIGGGSTEFSIGEHGLSKSVSIPMGAVRFAQKIMTSDPPRPKEILLAATEAAQRLLSFARFYHERFKGNNISFVGVGGTFTTLASMHMGLTVYDSNKVHGFGLKTSDVQKIFERIVTLNINQKKQIPGLLPERADIIVAGALIALVSLRVLDISVITISESDWCQAISLINFND